MKCYSDTPEPPYCAVIFGFRLRTTDTAEYLATADRLMEIARQLDGFYGEAAARVEGGFCLTVSYWRDEDSIRVWRENLEHTEARLRGKREWYESFKVRVARVERDYGFEFKGSADSGVGS
jgi:heme-degrading monooxygenase HmoA